MQSVDSSKEDDKEKNLKQTYAEIATMEYVESSQRLKRR